MNSRILSVLCMALVLGNIAGAQHAYTHLREFGFTAQAVSQPLSGLVQGPSGWLYGTSRGGQGGAVIYRIKNDGTGFAIVYDFGGTNTPSRGPLILGSDGALYGTVILQNGLDGGVYRIQPDGSGFQVYPLPIEAQIISGVIEASDGRLYGTTYFGGANEGGVAFGINNDGSGFTVLHDFAFGDGYQPGAEPLEGADGGLYMTTRFGGNENGGVVCRMNKNGSGFSILHHFPGFGTNDGRIPNSRLVAGPDNYLYGTTEAGGLLGEDDPFSGAGVVYRMLTDGDAYSVVRYFEAGINDGVKPRNVLLGTDGNLYGTSQNASYGKNVDGIFRMTTTGANFGFVYTWVSADNESVQLNGIFLAGDGSFYGTSAGGGASGVGQAFKVRPNGTQYQNLHEFSSTGADGRSPATLVRDTDGTFYGATLNGGANDAGTIYKLEANGAYSILHHFSSEDGFPLALLLASDGFLYGSSYFGEEIFRLSKDGVEFVTLTNLNAAPVGPLIEGSDFLLYGVTEDGGINELGSVFSLNADGTDLRVIHSFASGSTALVAPSGILEASDGKLYGAALRGGVNNRGMVFQMNKNGSQYAVLHSFPAGGPLISPNPLLAAGDGFLYGTTRLGGANGQGSIYRISTAGAYQLLHSFASDKGRPVGALAQGPDGWVYGVTEDSGTFEGGYLFRFKTGASTAVHVLHNFGAGLLGRNPAAGVATGPAGEIFGTTQFGGFGAGFGTVYRVEVRPILSVRRTGTNLELSWPWNGEEYELHSTHNLAAPWNLYGSGFGHDADRVTATVLPGPGDRFFRLEKAQGQPGAGQ